MAQPGWYDDPRDPQLEWWWDGSAWGQRRFKAPQNAAATSWVSTEPVAPGPQPSAPGIGTSIVQAAGQTLLNMLVVPAMLIMVFAVLLAGCLAWASTHPGHSSSESADDKFAEKVILDVECDDGNVLNWKLTNGNDLEAVTVIRLRYRSDNVTKYIDISPAVPAKSTRSGTVTVDPDPHENCFIERFRAGPRD